MADRKSSGCDSQQRERLQKKEMFNSESNPVSKLQFQSLGIGTQLRILGICSQHGVPLMPLLLRGDPVDVAWKLPHRQDEYHFQMCHTLHKLSPGVIYVALVSDTFGSGPGKPASMMTWQRNFEKRNRTVRPVAINADCFQQKQLWTTRRKRLPSCNGLTTFMKST